MTGNKNRLKGITFFIDSHIYEQLVKAATESDRSLSHLVRGIVRRFMDGEGCVSPRTEDTERGATIHEILTMDFSKLPQEAIHDLRRVSDEGVRELKAGLAALRQGGKR